MAGTRRKAGQLTAQVEGYRDWLTQRGYTPDTIRNMLKDLGQVGLWLSAEGLDATELDQTLIARFVATRREAGTRRVPGPRAMAPLLTYLREAGVAKAAQPSATALEVLLEQYRSWMVQDRNLASPTVLRYENTARRFLQEQATDGDGFDPAGLSGVDVNAFLLRECARVSVGSAKGRVAELRSVLRFLYLEAITPLRLGAAVPPVGGWRFATVPRTVAPADVQGLLDSCDRSTSLGIRDFAIITLVARLGLRSIEVARLQLRDLDWRAGEVIVRGKGRREDRLPLPTEVGEALVAYLFCGRNPAGAEHVFLTCRAPRGPIRADLVGDVVERACKRTGLQPVGPHRLRHALAGELLRHGAGLVAISQVLRHQDLATTALYAKVDLDALRPGCPSLGWSSAMSSLDQALADYLQLRRSLGHQLAEAAWLLPGFVAYLDAHGSGTATIATALGWAEQATAGTTLGPRRMTAARGFARYLAGIDAATEIPPLGLMPHRQRWRRPFIYSAAEIETLMGRARADIVSPLRAQTYATLIGLLAVTGLRIGEAIKLDRSDLDWAQGVLLIRESKFGKSRLVPLQASSVQALSAYAELRDRLQARPEEPSFFMSLTGKRLCYAVVSQTFRRLVENAGIGTDAPSAPRLHDLRHTFAVRTLLEWYRSEEDVQAKIPSLSTYLGHREPASTYWYLSAAPELLALAAAHQDTAWSAARTGGRP